MFRRPKPLPAGPGQRSVWSFPRPPAIEVESRPVRVEISGVVIASSERCVKVLETSHPPVYFFPPGDVRMDLLERNHRTSFCEWKGGAVYYDLCLDLQNARRGERDVAFSYETPSSLFHDYAGWLSFYADHFDGCFVDDERVRPQPGDYYSGWITDDVVGPFKGIPGSAGW